MNDERVWAFEESLWIGDADQYRALIDEACLMALPTPPYVLGGDEAIQAVIDTPRWTSVELDDRRVSRPEEGLIVIAYTARARRDGSDAYRARCTTTMRRIAHEEWRVVQHQQTPAP